MGSKGSAPAPPDYAALIPQQEAAYNRSFNRMLGSSRVNSQTPYGSMTWTRPGGYGTSQQPTAPVQGSPTAQGVQAPSGDSTNPTGLDVGDFGDPWTLTQQLSPDQQAILDSNERQAVGRGQINETMLSNVAQQYSQPQNFAGLMPGFNSNDPAQYQQGQYNPSAQYQQQDWRGPNYTSNVNSRDDAERAIYNRQMRYDQPQMERRRNQMQDRLLAQGANVADERYGNAMGDLYDSENRFLADAADRAILGGGQEATAELGRALMTEDPRFRAAQSEGQFGYNAATGENRYGQGFNQGERQFGYNAAQQGQQFRSAEDQRALNYALQNIGQQRADYLQPLNIMSAFQTGNQVNLPGTPAQFNTPNLQSVDPMNAAGQTYQGQLGQYNANQAGANNFMNGLFSLGAAYLGGR